MKAEILVFLAAAVVPAHGFVSIVLDYTHDSAGANFFPVGSEQRAALEAAASHINSVFRQNLGDIVNDPSTTTTVIEGRSSTITIDPEIGYANPETGALEIIPDVSVLGADEVRVYVGSRNLSDNTLAQGGRAAAGYGIGGTAFEVDLVTAVDNAAAAFNAEYERGGPVMSSLSSSVSIGATSAPFTLNFGPTVGHLWFDSDTDNDGDRDTAMELDGFWHFDHTSAVEAGQFDLFSVAVHEIFHTIGFGTSKAFADQVADGEASGIFDWTGPSVTSLLGTGENVLHTDASHINLSLSSLRLSDGLMQTPIMAPSIVSGARREITRLDVAFLDDMGYSVIPEIHPTSVLAPVIVIGSLCHRRRRRFASPAGAA